MAELTLASYNVHFGRGPRGQGFEPFDVVEAARRLDADVLVLQEAWVPDEGPGDPQRIAEALGMEVACATSTARMELGDRPKALGRSTHRGGNGSIHLAALTRVPVVSATTVPLPNLWLDPFDRAMLQLEVEVDGARLQVRGTHLPHLEHGVHFGTRGLRRTLPPISEPAAFVGDMNMWGWTIGQIVPRGWRRVVRGKTWPSHRPHSQIDHLLVTPAVEVAWSEVAPHLGSDHLPIRARLRW